MEWVVVWMSSTRNLASSLTGVNGAEGERKATGTDGVTEPLGMRLYRLGDRR
jgi:hypothetical protein